MKTPAKFVLSLLLAASSAFVGTSVVASVGASAEYQIIERGPNHKVVQHVNWQTDGHGKTVARTNSYTELATGMHYQDTNGVWQETKAEIEITDNGAVAVKGGHRVIFAPDFATAGAIDLETSDGKRLRSHILGLSYFDSASDRAVLIAEPKECIGELQPPNRVIYADAFDDLSADVEYIYSRAGFEQNVICARNRRRRRNSD